MATGRALHRSTSQAARSRRGDEGDLRYRWSGGGCLIAIRSNHYEAAFEAWLRDRRWPYVSVDEARRTLVAESSLKSLDFIVTAAPTTRWLVDVKGRRFPSGAAEAGNLWESWASTEDVDCLLQWEAAFGAGFRSLFVFAYDIVDPRYRAAHAEPWSFRGREYAFYGVWADEYARSMRRRSPRWDTVSLPAREYAQMRIPLQNLIS